MVIKLASIDGKECVKISDDIAKVIIPFVISCIAYNLTNRHLPLVTEYRSSRGCNEGQRDIPDTTFVGFVDWSGGGMSLQMRIY